MKSIKLFPVLTLVFFLSTLWLLYERNLAPPTPDKTEITATLSSPEVEPAESSSTPALAEEEQAELQRLRDLENEHKELKLLNERLSAELKIASKSKESLERMEAGRAMLRDFEKRFLNSQMFREEGGFLSFLRNKSEAYLNRGELKLKSRTMKDEEWRQLHQELTQWLLEQNDENIEGAAQFMGFFFAETLYEIPLTLLASRLVPELEGIDFETPVMIGKTLTTPQRDTNGEIIVSEPAHLDQYTMSQQFYYRRGPKITGKTSIFLKAFLNYSDF